MGEQKKQPEQKKTISYTPATKINWEIQHGNDGPKWSPHFILEGRTGVCVMPRYTQHSPTETVDLLYNNLILHTECLNAIQGCVYVCERERDRDRERYTERERDTQTDRQTDREIE